MTASTLPSTAQEVLVNPVLGLRATVIADAPDRFAADVVARPGANGGPAHIHRAQEERFEVLDGELTFRAGRRRGVLRAGDVLVVPSGTVHAFRNDGDVDAHFVAEFRPALRVHAFFDALFALARAGRTDARGLPSPRDTALLMRDFPAEFFYLPHIPVRVQQAIASSVRTALGARGSGSTR